MNARATSWVTHGDATIFLQRQHDLEPCNKSTVSWRQTLCNDISVEQGMTTVKHARVCGNEQDQSHHCQYVRATQDERHATLPPAVTNLSCTAQLCWTRLRTSRISMWVFQATPHIAGFFPVYRDTNSLTPPVGYSGSLSTVNETCNKDKGHCTKKQYCRCTAYKSPRTLKSGVYLFAALENSLNRRVGVFQCTSSNLRRQRVSRACPSVFAWHSLIDSA